jgi:hypothetical protein
MQINMVDPKITRRHPNRDVSVPASGMATIELEPRQSSRRPMAPFSRPTRALAKGTSGAQAATATPAMKKKIRVERCPGRPVSFDASVPVGVPDWKIAIRTPVSHRGIGSRSR